MNKSKYILTIISLFIILPSIAYADCTAEEVKHFKEIEDEYKITYELDSNIKKYNVHFKAGNTSNYGFESEFGDEVTCEVESKEERRVVCYNVEPNTYTIKIVGTTETCNNTLKIINLELPKPNPYYQDPLCEGIEEFVLCQEIYNKDIDYDTFKSRVNTYKKTLEKKGINSQETTKDNNLIIKYLEDNIIKIIVLVVFAVVIIVTIILTIKSAKKSRRLE